jgi:3-deoxy-manno-octulosonate cytidylyltransferase (CMP-KDO synthetase)
MLRALMTQVLDDSGAIDSRLPRHPVVVIPARMTSLRLPDKPLADIHGEPMIVHVWRRAVEAEVGPVIVACAEAEIAAAVERAGGQAVLTRPDHPSGSDRVFEAVQRLDPEGTHDAVINIQGDLPTIEPEAVRAVFAPLADPQVDIATLAVEITVAEERQNPNVTKAAVVFPEGGRVARAHYFSRSPVPWPGAEDSGSPLEGRERLEQLRAIEAGMRIDVALVDTVPLGVDTPADLDRARALMAQSSD